VAAGVGHDALAAGVGIGRDALAAGVGIGCEGVGHDALF